MNLKDELIAIREREGLLTPQVVLDTARDPNHPLHNRFEWDDSVAAERYRLEQAHKLIVKVKIRIISDDPAADITIRAFQAVLNPATRSGFAYDPSEEVAQDPLKRSMQLRQMERDWRTLKARWEQFSEFVEMIQRDLNNPAA